MCHFQAEGFSFFADAAHHVSDDSSEAILCTFFPHNVLSLFPMSDISLSRERHEEVHLAPLASSSFIRGALSLSLTPI